MIILTIKFYFKFCDPFSSSISICGVGGGAFQHSKRKKIRSSKAEIMMCTPGSVFDSNCRSLRMYREFNC